MMRFNKFSITSIQQFKHKHKFNALSASTYYNGKSVRAVIIKTRSSSVKATLKKTYKGQRSTSVPVDRKENIAFHSHEVLVPQPSCSRVHQTVNAQSIRPVHRVSKTIVRSKLRRDSMKAKNFSVGDKPTKTTNQGSSLQNTSLNYKQKQKPDVAPKMRTIRESSPKSASFESRKSSSGRMQLREICFVKDSDGKKVIAKYKTDETKSESCTDNLIVSWGSCSSEAQVFSQKDDLLPNKNMNDAGPSRQGAFRVHNFAKSGSASKIKKGKRNLRRFTTTAESAVKGDRLKKRKKVKGKVV